MGLKGCKWSSLNAPGTETPQSHPNWKLQEFPFRGRIRQIRGCVFGEQYFRSEFIPWPPPPAPAPRLRFSARIHQKMNETEGFQCLGHSNWTICSPLSQFCSENFPTFSLSYWEANSYYPKGPIMGRGNSSNSKTEWDRGFPVPRTFKLDHFQPVEPLLFC